MSKSPEQRLEEVEAIADPATRARLATELLSTYQTMVNKLARIRRRAIAELRATGLSYGQVADALGISRGRIAQLHTTSNLIEQDFFGGTSVTIATPLRTAGAERPFIAQEDFEAAMVLTKFLNSFDIETELDQVAPTGEIDFTPNALIAICGPKSSHVMKSVIDTDPIYEFGPDNSGRWRILSRRSGDVFSSPIDDEPSANQDFAYLARLHRPDNDQTFLVIAGIHAIGSLGAAAYLTEPSNLHSLHRVVGNKVFSTVVSSEFNRSPLQIVSSELAIPPILHEG